jgi:uncharacterized glyoxalase superfamily protein PhnB
LPCSNPERRCSLIQAIPADYAGVTPYLIVRDAARMLDFYKKGFGATEVLRLPAPGGKIDVAPDEMDRRMKAMMAK